MEHNADIQSKNQIFLISVLCIFFICLAIYLYFEELDIMIIFALGLVLIIIVYFFCYYKNTTSSLPICPLSTSLPPLSISKNSTSTHVTYDIKISGRNLILECTPQQINTIQINEQTFTPQQIDINRLKYFDAYMKNANANIGEALKNILLLLGPILRQEAALELWHEITKYLCFVENIEDTRVNIFCNKDLYTASSATHKLCVFRGIDQFVMWQTEETNVGLFLGRKDENFIKFIANQASQLGS